MGIGFAIPANLAKSVVTQLADHGHVVRGWLGVTIQPLTPELAKAFQREDKRGALVSSVADGSPAQKAGLKPGDIITEYNGRPVAKSDDLPRAVAETPVGKDVTLTDHPRRQGHDPDDEGRRAGRSRHADGCQGREPRAASGSPSQPLTPSLARELGLKAAQGVVVADVAEGSPAADRRAAAARRDRGGRSQQGHVGRGSQEERGPEEGQGRRPMLLLVNRDGQNLYVAVVV